MMIKIQYTYKRGGEVYQDKIGDLDPLELTPEKWRDLRNAFDHCGFKLEIRTEG